MAILTWTEGRKAWKVTVRDGAVQAKPEVGLIVGAEVAQAIREKAQVRYSPTGPVGPVSWFDPRSIAALIEANRPIGTVVSIEWEEGEEFTAEDETVIH